MEPLRIGILGAARIADLAIIKPAQHNDVRLVAVAARDAGLGVVFITHNPHHAFLVGNHFIILKLGRRVLDKTRDEVTLEELTTEMAGGRELAELSHELRT